MFSNLYSTPNSVTYESSKSVLIKIDLTGKLLIITDKDGTLDNSHQTEAVHSTPVRTINTLSSICRDSENFHSVAVISGRNLSTLLSLTGAVQDFWYFGSHGIEFHHPNEVSGRIDIPEDFIAKLDLCERILCSGVSKNQILSSNVKIERDLFKLNSWWSSECAVKEGFLELLSQAILESGINDYVEVLSGVTSRELLPRGAGKGYAVKTLIDIIKPDFILCAGNDIPDLEMYKAVFNSGIAHVNLVIGSDILFKQAIHFRSPDCLTELFLGLSAKIAHSMGCQERINSLEEASLNFPPKAS